MAKQEKPEAVTVWAQPNDIFWFPEMNFGRHEALVDDTKKQNRHAVIISNAPMYWMSKEAVPVIIMDEATREKAKVAIEALRTSLAGAHPEEEFPTVPTAKKLSDSQLREGFNALYYPNGELHLPKYDGIACFQRGTSLFKAVARLISEGKSPEEAVKLMRIPVEIHQLKNHAERVILCGLENTSKDLERTSIMGHWPSLFKLGKSLFDATAGTCTMAEINRIINGGVVKNSNSGIMINSLLKLNQRFPEVGISDKIEKAGTGPKGEDFGQKFVSGLDRTQVWKFAQWLDGAAFQEQLANGDKYAVKRAKTGGTGMTKKEELVDYLANPSAYKDDEKDKMAEKSVVDARLLQTPNLIEKYILDAVATNRMERLSRLNVPGISIESLTSMNEFAKKLGLVDENGVVVA